MNITSKEKQIQALNALVEGCSIRSTERMTNIHRDTIMRLLVHAGDMSQRIMDNLFKDFHCEKVQVDEIWTFVKKKEKKLTDKEKLRGIFGDQYVFVALDADTKLIPTFTVGKRNKETAMKFMADLRKKLNGNGRIQLTSDGFTSFIPAVEDAFGADIDYAQLIKTFSHTAVGGYAQPELVEVVSHIINGNPEWKHISTSYIERQNLTMRMAMRRFTRLTNAFSKKLENLKAAISLHFAHYNFIRVHQTLKITPPVSDRQYGAIP